MMQCRSRGAVVGGQLLCGCRFRRGRISGSHDDAVAVEEAVPQQLEGLLGR